jgi:uncharacterized protein (TIGR02284 family)
MAEERQAVPERRGDAIAAALAQMRPGDPGHAAYPLDETRYWREALEREPYYQPGRGFEDYATAYELGWVAYQMYGGEFDTAERVVANEWLVRKGVSTLSWDEARPAARAAWQRAHNARSFATDGTAAPDAIRETLARLFTIARDGELGFREAATHARAPELVALLERLAADCAQDAAQWQQSLAQLGAAVDEGGTVAGAAQRVWLQLRGLFGGASDATLLGECERGQDLIVAEYGEGLRRNLPPPLHALVQREFEQAQRQHDHIRSVRERASSGMPDREVAA